MLRFQALCDQPHQLRVLTGLEPHEFMLLAHLFDHLFVQRMENETLDGYQREGKAYRTYVNCPLPPPEDKLLFILTYLRQNTIQAVHGQLFGMTQSNVSKWYHILLPILRRTFATQDFLPARTPDELWDMLTDTDESGAQENTSSETDPGVQKQEPAPFFTMMEQNVP